jgi:hypothetical protein
MPQRERGEGGELGKHKIATAEMKILGTPQNTWFFTTKRDQNVLKEVLNTSRFFTNQQL